MSTRGANSLMESQVVCPHCWHRFYADQAHFISNHAELFGDEVLPNEQRRFPPHEVQRDRAGNALDPKGMRMTERACPLCHSQIPPDLLTQRAHIVSVVGAPRAGKTYFLTAMLHTLRKELPRYFAYSLHDSDSHSIEAFLEYERTLFYANDPNEPTFLAKTQEAGRLYTVAHLSGMQVQLPKPFIFSLRPTAANLDVAKCGDGLRRNIVLYDNAGESFDLLKEKDGTSRVTQHLSECDAVIFAFDPLQDPEARRHLAAGSRDPQLSTAAVSSRQETILAETIHRMRRRRNVPDGQPLDVALAICVQKYDIWKSLVPHAVVADAEGRQRHIIDHSSVEYVANLGVGCLDVEEINRISLLVQCFIEDVCPEFAALAEANFRSVRYFAVSALGASPEHAGPAATTGEHLKIRPAHMQPFRVTDALLWLMYRWRLIRYAQPRAHGAKRYPHGRIQSVAADRMRVVSPLSQRVLLLDSQFAGNSIVDPYSGGMLWVPPLDTAKAPVQNSTAPVGSSVTAPGQVAATGSPPPKLKLDEPVRPTRQRWFKR